MSGKVISASEALDRVFSVIREEAASNPKLARRLVEEMGATVVFQGNDAAIAVDPVIAATRHDQAAFREMFSTFSDAELKKMLKDFGLATAEDIKGVNTKPKKIGFIELLWDGARSKLV